MDLRRFSIVLFFFAAAIILYVLLMQSQKARRQAAQKQPETATQPTARTSLPAGQAATATSVETSPAAPTMKALSTGPKVFTNGLDSEKLVWIGSPDPRSGYMFQLELTNHGAGVFTAKLSNYHATVADKKRYKEDPNTYEAACRKNPEKYKGPYSVLNPVGVKGRPKHLPMATKAIIVEIEGEPKPITANLDALHWRLGETASREDSDSASFYLTIYRGFDLAEARKSPLVRIVKTYTARKEDYSIAMSLRLENLSGKPMRVTLDQAGPTGLPREGLRADMRQVAYAYRQAADQRVQDQLKPAGKLHQLQLGEKHELKMRSSTPMLWVGHVNKFFGSMMYLRPAIEERLEAATYAAKFYVSATMESAHSRTYLTGLQIPQLVLKAGQDKELVFDIFTGPKKRDVFANEDARHFKKLYKELNYIGTIDFGGCFCTFSWLSLAMMWLLDRFSWVALGNYGVAIIMLVLLVRLVLHPLTKKSQVSMMRMQKLAPQMQKLKEKYADDKNTLNKEMMKLYKEQGTSPLLGCLPMFLQMPIWFALYTGLNAAVALRHAAFLPVWITDLAAPDALFTWSEPVMFLGTSFNLLPILLAIAMFLSQKYGPQSAQAAASDQARQQQKMMKYMFPAMMVVFFYKAPSGLTLYIMASTFAGLLDQYFVRKHIRDKEAAEAAEQTTVRVPGKAARGSRPKKPKGPFWTKHG